MSGGPRALLSAGLRWPLNGATTALHWEGLAAAASTTCSCSCTSPTPSATAGCQVQPQQRRRFSGAAEASSSGPTASSATGGAGAGAEPWAAFFSRPGRRKPRPGAWRERMPGKGVGEAGGGRYGVLLRERDPERFERMRMVLGYYDLPENAGLPRPPPPARAAISNLQALFFTRDVDAYYRLALLSYRSKLANRDLVAPSLAAADVLLARLDAEAAEFVPALPPPQQQQQQQQPEGLPAGPGGEDGGKAAAGRAPLLRGPDA